MRSPQYSVPTTLALVISSLLAPNAFAEESEQDTETMIVRSTAEEALKQQPGVSIITAEDIAKQPPVNDLSDIIRKMPGVNLTGNSASGSRGNNRQIDIRGMGPENTLILIDGVPVTSRNAVRYSWRGERDTRGDSNWVPAEMVERIEVLRGPAAARSMVPARRAEWSISLPNVRPTPGTVRCLSSPTSRKTTKKARPIALTSISAAHWPARR